MTSTLLESYQLLDSEVPYVGYRINENALPTGVMDKFTKKAVPFTPRNNIAPTWYTVVFTIMVLIYITLMILGLIYSAKFGNEDGNSRPARSNMAILIFIISLMGIFGTVVIGT